jgi:hypothetical protein
VERSHRHARIVPARRSRPCNDTCRHPNRVVEACPAAAE